MGDCGCSGATDGRRRPSATATTCRWPATDVDADIRAHLRAQGEDPAGWRVTLVTNLRSLGYVFNPASFFLCRDAAGDLRTVVVEVHNTFGERHLYTLRRRRADDADRPFQATMAKDFFVSPFIDLDGRYSVFVRDDADALHLSIALRQDEAPMLSTSLVLRRLPAHRPDAAADARPSPAAHPAHHRR